ncbi:4'-phosphopantetheinyl transferase superfamily protein [Cellulomonas sp. Sa3CUA2]|uniref:4'-phosphopantetheinyl transferase superfamily protein n=1 Tax=Cellulomonas avistercoris TaxID=2762242 RepID=A0ABR8QGI8_9CELL|nr:4'-phosphopantetheinyl transferase superfamily protein [Cellulomonas avistercoris]MBD7919550.1 4'-phosphopantetheinyl transferase superfamily protein [Cellulomonas avistercoris]
MLADLLPPGVVGVEAFGASAAAPLLGDEAAAVARAVPARRAEYAAVRACARDALELLGAGRPAVPSAPDRSPVWPAGVVGALTHCDGYRAAAVARADAWVGVGIDAEPLAALPAGVADLVMSHDERAAHAAGTWPERLVFSAKESVYKVWSPAVGTWLGFEDVRIGVGDGVFTAHVDRPGLGVDVLHGRWAAGRGLVVTALALPR